MASEVLNCPYLRPPERITHASVYQVLGVGIQRTPATDQSTGLRLGFCGAGGKCTGKGLSPARTQSPIDTTIFLVVIELVGTAVLTFFGISLPVMQVSGGIVLAAMGILSPIFAAFAMSVSSLAVLINARRLQQDV